MLIQSKVIGSFMLPAFIINLQIQRPANFLSVCVQLFKPMQGRHITQFTSGPRLPKYFIIQRSLLVKCMVEK